MYIYYIPWEDFAKFRIDMFCGMIVSERKVLAGIMFECEGPGNLAEAFQSGDDC